MTHVQILLFDGFDELDAIGPLEVLRRASEKGSLRVELATLGGATEVTASYGLRVGVEATFDPSEPPDVLVVPGGGWSSPGAQGVRVVYDDGALPEAIAEAHRSGTVIAAVCTGALLLAKTGLLEGRPAATHHTARADLQAHGVNVQEARVVDDGDVLTAGGVTSGLDLALHLVERLVGRDAAEAIAREMEYERRRLPM